MKRLLAICYILLFILFWVQMTVLSQVSVLSLEILLIGLLMLTLGIVSNLISEKVLHLRLHSTMYRFGSGFIFYTLISIISLIFFRDRTFDLQWHNTYYIIGHVHLAILFAVLFAVFTFAYKTLEGSTSETLGNFHFVSSITVTILMLIQIYHSSEIEPSTSFNRFDMMKYLSDTRLFFYSIRAMISCLLIFQLFFVLNLVFSILKKVLAK